MDWEESNERFVNPYNFINIDENCIRKSLKSYEDDNNLITGYIECEIIPRTPIVIPNTSNNDAFKMSTSGSERKTFDFYSYDDLSDKNNLNEKGSRNGVYSKPIIPGSEIRGVVRSAFEAVTNSCMSTIDTDQILYKRTFIPKNPGILQYKQGRWYITPVDTVMVRLKNKKCAKDSFEGINKEDYKEGEKVFIKKSDDMYPKENKYKRKIKMPYTVEKISKQKFQKSEIGYFHKGEDISNKHHESIFLLPQEPQKLQETVVPDEAVYRLGKVIELYRNEKINITMRKGDHKGYPEFKVDEEEGNIILVYFTKVEDIYYLSPACITKEVFRNKIDNIICFQGEHEPCRNKDNLCEACALFGMAGDTNENSLGTKIRFTDAIPDNKANNKDYYMSEGILDELASPKISATEFYLKKPSEDAELWNYDYYLIKLGHKKVYKTSNPEIRGRKFYWHCSRQGYSNDLGTLNDRNCMVRPVKKSTKENEIRFKFRVYFDKVPKEQLTKLVWTLNIGDNDNSNYHKIGKGKPIGFGSIKIKVNQIITRVIKKELNTINYELIPHNIDELDFNVINKNSIYIKEFLKITDFKYSSQNINYPIGKTKKRNGEISESSYQWFIGNNSSSKVKYLLPEISEPDITLPELKKI